MCVAERGDTRQSPGGISRTVLPDETESLFQLFHFRPKEVLQERSVLFGNAGRTSCVYDRSSQMAYVLPVVPYAQERQRVAEEFFRPRQDIVKSPEKQVAVIQKADLSFRT